MSSQTQPRKGNGAFPPTRISAIVAAASGDRAERERGLGLLVAAYWMPVYKYIRLKWGSRSAEDARDLTQGFFTEAIDKGFFDRYDPSRARFRTFLRTCLDGFVANDAKAAARLKRGGRRNLPLPGLRGSRGTACRGAGGGERDRRVLRTGVHPQPLHPGNRQAPE